MNSSQGVYFSSSLWRPLSVLAFLGASTVIASLSPYVSAALMAEDETTMVESAPAPVTAAEAEVIAERAEGYTGTWRYADGDAGRSEVQAAVAAATDEMVLGKGIARDRLEEGFAPNADDEISIEFVGAAVDLTIPGCPKLDDVALGHTVQWTCGGEVLQVNHLLEADALIQRGHTNGLEIERQFSVEGDTLTLHVDMRHDKLPDPVSFDLHFTR